MATPFIVSKGNQERATYIQQPVTIMQAAATAGYQIQLPPGTYHIAMTVNSSVTGTSTTIGTLRPYANKAQTRVTNKDLLLKYPPDTGLTTLAMTFAAGNGASKFATVSPTSAFQSERITIPYGLRFVVTKGGAAEGEIFEVTVVASKVG